MNKVNESVVRKIQKLLKLKESPNEEEAMSAAAKASELMLKYNLDIKDCEGGDEEKLTKLSVSDVKMKRWEVDLMHTIVQYGNIVVWILKDFVYKSRRKQSRYKVIGSKDNIEMFGYMYSYLFLTFKKLAKSHVRSINDSKQSKKLKRKSYLMGLVKGLGLKLVSENNKNQEKGLVLVKPDAPQIEGYGDEKEVKQRNIKIDSLSMLMGIKDGKEVQTNKGISPGK